jgi:hypothetical protein
VTRTMPLRVAACLVAAGAVTACATGGPGNDPSFGGVVAADAEDSADAGASDDAPTGDDGESPDADTCDDPAHGAVALITALAGHATTCTMSSQCAPGQCCFANSSISACVMQ